MIVKFINVKFSIVYDMSKQVEMTFISLLIKFCLFSNVMFGI